MAINMGNIVRMNKMLRAILVTACLLAVIDVATQQPVQVGLPCAGENQNRFLHFQKESI